MPKLTDSQLVILSAAIQREDGAALPLPKSLKIKGAAVTKTLDGLRKKGLLEERPASREVVAWREAEDGRRMMLVISEPGRQAIDGVPAEKPAKQPVSTKTQTKKPRGRAARRTAGSKVKDQKTTPAVRQGTKQALLIDLLSRKTGATIDEIVEATGWQAHSARGAISGGLKKKLGLAVSSEKVDGRGRVYRIVGQG